MDCEGVARGELAEEYLQGRLDAARQDDFEAHILECEKCLRAVEALQTVRDDLAARAHEIRVYSVSRGRLRWSWVGVAALVLIVGGVFTAQFLRHRDAGTGVAQQKAPQKGVAAPETPEKTAAGPSQSASKLPEEPRQPVQGGSSQAINAGLPKKTKPSQAIPNLAPQGTTPSPTPVLANNPENPPVPESHVAGGTPNPEVATSPAGGKNATTQTQTQAQASGTPPGIMSDEGERELFRLSAVQPAAYDFSGVSSHTRVSPGSDAARTGHVQSPGEQRAKFENAMRAYVDRNYDEAVDLLQRVLETEPSAADANFYYGVTLLLKGRPDQAFEPLKTAAADKRSRWAQPAHFYLAKAYLQTRDLASAEMELKAAAAITGNLTASARADLASLQALRSKENR
jgi:tetratricopeptide repeat protein